MQKLLLTLGSAILTAHALSFVITYIYNQLLIVVPYLTMRSLTAPFSCCATLQLYQCWVHFSISLFSFENTIIACGNEFSKLMCVFSFRIWCILKPNAVREVQCQFRSCGCSTVDLLQIVISITGLGTRPRNYTPITPQGLTPRVQKGGVGGRRRSLRLPPQLLSEQVKGLWPFTVTFMGRSPGGPPGGAPQGLVPHEGRASVRRPGTE